MSKEYEWVEGVYKMLWLDIIRLNMNCESFKIVNEVIVLTIFHVPHYSKFFTQILVLTHEKQKEIPQCNDYNKYKFNNWWNDEHIFYRRLKIHKTRDKNAYYVLLLVLELMWITVL